MDERRSNNFSNDASRVPTDPENRRGKDRRINRKSSLKYFLFNGRRERIRREEDRGKVFFFRPLKTKTICGNQCNFYVEHYGCAVDIDPN